MTTETVHPVDLGRIETAAKAMSGDVTSFFSASPRGAMRITARGQFGVFQTVRVKISLKFTGSRQGLPTKSQGFSNLWRKEKN